MNSLNIKRLPAILLLAAISMCLKAQDTQKPAAGDQPKAVIKLNLSPLLFRNLTLQGEYAFHKNLSAALGFYYLVPRSLPSWLMVLPKDFSRPEYGGWGLTPELRFYPGKKLKEPAPNGFYIAGYLRHSRNYVAMKYTFDAQNYLDFRFEYNPTTVGLMVGYQVLAGRHFSLDLWILGYGVGRAAISMEASTNAFTIDPAYQQQLEQAFRTSKYFYSGDLEVTDRSVKFSTSAFTNSFRGLGLNLGFAF
jgi:hypothetical protein